MASILPVAGVGLGDQARFGYPQVKNSAGTVAPSGWVSSRFPATTSVSYLGEQGGTVWFAFEQQYTVPTGLNTPFNFGGTPPVSGASGGDQSKFGIPGVKNAAQEIKPQGFAQDPNLSKPVVFEPQEGVGGQLDFNFSQPYTQPLQLNTPFYFGGSLVVTGITVGDTSRFGVIQEVRKPLQISPVGKPSSVLFGKPRVGDQPTVDFPFVDQYAVKTGTNTPFDFGGVIVISVGLGVDSKFGLSGVANKAKGVTVQGIPPGNFGTLKVFDAAESGAEVDFRFEQDYTLKPSPLNTPYYFAWESRAFGEGWVSTQFGGAEKVWLYHTYTFWNGHEDSQFGNNTVENWAEFAVFPQSLQGGARFGEPTVAIAPKYFVSADIRMDTMIVDVQAEYDSAVSRPTVWRANITHQDCNQLQAKVLRVNHEDTRSIEVGTANDHKDAVPVNVGAEHVLPNRLTNVTLHRDNRHQDGREINNNFEHLYEVGQRVFGAHLARFQNAEKLTGDQEVLWKNMLRDRRKDLHMSHQVARPLEFGSYQDWQVATPKELGWAPRHQEAMRPKPAQAPIVIPPKPKLCYEPSPHLVFKGSGAIIDGNLLYICEYDPAVELVDRETIVIPVRKAYIVMNEVRLFKVGSPDIELPVLNLSLEIDMDSWTWGFSVQLPMQALPDVYSSVVGSPVELRARINGEDYRLLAEKVSRSRQFGKASVVVSGRGISAFLADPYSPQKNFSSQNDATAQQLFNNALTDNNVSIGWLVDWGITDWFVPGNVWSTKGTYKDAVSSIAKSVGAFIYPHPSEQKLFVKPRYYKYPWEWPLATPDIELPSSVVETESVQWEEYPQYDGVYVSGVSQGVLAHVRRSGTLGGTLAPMFTDSLITRPEAARMKGSELLSKTGKVATIKLSLPVLPETGIIKPGNLIRYTDNGESIKGMVKGVQIAARELNSLRQTIEVEAHA